MYYFNMIIVLILILTVSTFAFTIYNTYDSKFSHLFTRFNHYIYGASTFKVCILDNNNDVYRVNTIEDTDM